MTGPERGFLLLSSCLGDPDRKPLTTAQLRLLAQRSWQLDPSQDRQLEVRDLTSLGYGPDMAMRILSLLEQEDLLEHYLRRGRKADCVPLTRASKDYPLSLRRRLGLDSPGVLWAKGDLSLLQRPMLSLVGSRELRTANQSFAAEVGRQAARQGYTLVSGNARGADRTAQESCLRHGGNVVIVVADELSRQPQRGGVLYLSEEDFDLPFSSQRALSRNRVIHALGSKTLVAQCSLETGGTWDGTVKNLRFGWSPVFCFDDGSPAAQRLHQMGAALTDIGSLSHIPGLTNEHPNLFDQ